MITNIFTLGLLGLAAASPLGKREVGPNYPPKGSSKGFNLVLNVTDLSADFSPSIQNAYVASIHTGAGQALVGIISDIDSARVFYQNGTATENSNGESNILSDGGTPPAPQGLQLALDKGSETVATATMNYGPGTAGLRLSRLPEPYAFLVPETFVACNTSLAYYSGKYFITIKHAETTVDETGTIKKNIPEGCAPVRLVPQCATLDDLPAGSLASHEFALDSPCYSNVAALDWKSYGP
ncbi:hypothetical protein HJFPF1_11433 [Paramyrothecium foliicola]|nr:hypothetical protein HJFPF1_11433 [Paramyrothecium foliicola]